MTRTFVNAKARFQRGFEARFGRRDAGQGMLEYIGILVVAAVLIVGVLTAFDVLKPKELANTQVTKISTELSKERG